MDDKRFQQSPSKPPEEQEQNWRDVLYDEEGFEEMWRLLEEIEYLVELEEAPFRLRLRP
ncbi:MAG: hypothetical protein M3Y75_02505 [Actinomycetota bacterium]|nr:hypothetical protein [Actinomycetota bacterium]